MKRTGLTTVVLCALPYLVAFAVPTIVLAVLYGAAGQSPWYGLFGGAIGLLGALLATLARGVIMRYRGEAQLDEMLEWLRKEQEREEAENRWADTEHKRSLLRMHRRERWEQRRRDEQRHADDERTQP